MEITGNYMIDADNGASSFSPLFVEKGINEKQVECHLCLDKVESESELMPIPQRDGKTVLGCLPCYDGFFEYELEFNTLNIPQY